MLSATRRPRQPAGSASGCAGRRAGSTASARASDRRSQQRRSSGSEASRGRGGIEKGSGRTGASRAARVCVRRDVGGSVLSEDRAPSGRDVSRSSQRRSPLSRAAHRRGATRPANRRERRRCHVVRAARSSRCSRRDQASVIPTTLDGVRVRHRRHGDDRGALGDAPLSATCPHRRLDRPCGRRDGNAGGEGHERSERLCALEQPRLRRGQRGKHRGSHPPAWPH